MENIFVNRSRQIRSGWKISIVLGIFLGTTVLLSILATLIFGIIYTMNKVFYDNLALDLVIRQFTQDIMTNKVFNFIMMAMQSLSMVAAVLFVLRFIDKRKSRDIGIAPIKRSLKELVYGLTLGAVSMCIIFFVLLELDNIKLLNSITSPDFKLSTLTGLVTFILVGFNEELFSRGYCINALNQTGKRWIAVLVSSIIFSVLHVLNPNVSIIGLINIFLVGILFAYMYIKTGNLWMPIGYHITWNYFQSNIFGFPVSGMSLEGIYNITILQDNMINGGKFGPEGGLLATVVILLGFLTVWMYNNQGKNLIDNIKSIKENSL